MLKALNKTLFLGTIAILLTGTLGCSSFKFPWAYVITVRQGNILDKEMLDQLEVSMTKRQVRYVLGTPLVEDTFHPDRWDYYFSMRRDEKELYNYRLTVYFEDGKLTHWDGTTDALRSKKDGLIEEGSTDAEKGATAEKKAAEDQVKSDENTSETATSEDKPEDTNKESNDANYSETNADDSAQKSSQEGSKNATSASATTESTNNDDEAKSES